MLSPFDLALAVIGLARRVLIWGEAPSTGKSYLAMTGNTNGKPVYSGQCHGSQPAEDWIGTWKLVDGSMLWQDGVAITAWRNGGRLVIDELDHYSPEVRSVLHKILDDPEFASYTLPTGEVVRPAPGFEVVATMNASPDVLPEPLASRFPVQIEATEVNPAALLALPQDLRAMAKETVTHYDAARRISLRAWMEFASLRAARSADVAAQAVFGHRGQDILDALRIGSAYEDVATEDESEDATEDESEDVDTGCDCDSCRRERGELEDDEDA